MIDGLPENPGRVLLIRPSALGDVARSAPALATVRAAWPEARIDWLVGRPYGDIVREHPALAHRDGGGCGVVPFDRRPWWKSVGLVGRLMRTRYDIAIDLQGLLRSALFAKCASRHSVGMSIAREGAAKLYRHVIDVPDGLHAVERELRLLEGIGLTRVEDPTLVVPTADCGLLENVFLEEQRILDKQKRGLARDRVLAIAPFTRWGCKDWPTERYLTLANRLIRSGHVDRVVVVCSEADEVKVDDFFDDWPDQDFADNVLIPTTTVGQMMDVIASSDVLVCNDSGPLHLAVGLGTPTVSFFGPTDPALVGPYVTPDTQHLHRVLQPEGAARGENRHRELRDDNSLISRITVEQAEAAVVALLSAGESSDG